MSAEMITSNGITLYSVKFNIVSVAEMCQGILQNHKTLNPKGVLHKIYKSFVGFFQEHMSGTTHSIYMLFKTCVTHNECDHNIYMLLKNHITNDKCDHDIHMLLQN